MLNKQLADEMLQDADDLMNEIDLKCYNVNWFDQIKKKSEIDLKTFTFQSANERSWKI